MSRPVLQFIKIIAHPIIRHPAVRIQRPSPSGLGGTGDTSKSKVGGGAPAVLPEPVWVDMKFTVAPLRPGIVVSEGCRCRPRVRTRARTLAVVSIGCP